MIAFKLVRCRKDGTLGPLFCNAKLRMPIGEWMDAEVHPTKGLAVRPGWHAVPWPHAPHLSQTARVWVQVELEDWTDHYRPAAQGGLWHTAQRMRVTRVLTSAEVDALLQIRDRGLPVGAL